MDRGSRVRYAANVCQGLSHRRQRKHANRSGVNRNVQGLKYKEIGNNFFVFNFTVCVTCNYLHCFFTADITSI